MSVLAHVAFVGLVFPLAYTATINPRFAKNVTLYHVNERSYSAAPVNMNTADLNGDMYFDLRSRGLPLECGAWYNQSFWSRLDCSNPEVANVSSLAITKIMLEVDTRWGDYSNCNDDPHTGIYSCDFQDCPDNCAAIPDNHGNRCDWANGCMWDKLDERCEPYGCSNKTDQSDCVHGYDTCVWNARASKCEDPPGPGPVCNKTLVGRLDLTTVDWGRHAHHGETPSKVDCWHGNALSKTNGIWYSTLAVGECQPNNPAQTFCSWRLVKTIKKVSKSCSDDAINAVIVEGDRSASWGARCFDKCSPADQKNKTSECWIECFYANVLGPNGSSSLLNHTSPNFGISLAELQAAWDKPFLPVEQGGCPALPPTSDSSMDNVLV